MNHVDINSYPHLIILIINVYILKYTEDVVTVVII